MATNDTTDPKEKEDSKVKDLENSIGNSTKIPDVHEDEDSTKAAIGKAGKKANKVVKIEESSADDGKAFVSPEEKNKSSLEHPYWKESTGRC